MNSFEVSTIIMVIFLLTINAMNCISLSLAWNKISNLEETLEKLGYKGKNTKGD